MRDCFMTTERLGFSIWGEDDGALAQTLWSNARVTRYLSARGVFSPEEIEARLHLEMENARLHGVQYWPLFLLDGGDFTGCCGLRPFGDEAGAYELGFHLLPEFWGRGLATEAGRAAIDYAQRVLGARSLFAGHHPDNTVSGHVLQKLGFESIGARFYAPTGLLHPSYRYPDLGGTSE